MSSPLLHVGAVAMCPHAAPMNVIPGQTRVTVSGQPVATLTDTALIAGCQFKPPCVKAQYTMGATRVLLNNVPALLTTSVGLAVGVAPQGTVSVVQSQTRVTGV